jgi:hypothetical protein
MIEPVGPDCVRPIERVASVGALPTVGILWIQKPTVDSTAELTVATILAVSGRDRGFIFTPP